MKNHRWQQLINLYFAAILLLSAGALFAGKSGLTAERIRDDYGIGMAEQGAISLAFGVALVVWRRSFWAFLAAAAVYAITVLITLQSAIDGVRGWDVAIRAIGFYAAIWLLVIVAGALDRGHDV